LGDVGEKVVEGARVKECVKFWRRWRRKRRRSKLNSQGDQKKEDKRGLKFKVSTLQCMREDDSGRQ
jgi:hypothetical protein